jgi:hypothetical protein
VRLRNGLAAQRVSHHCAPTEKAHVCSRCQRRREKLDLPAVTKGVNYHQPVGANYPTRLGTFATVAAFHFPPRAVAMPRPFKCGGDLAERFRAGGLD